MRLFARRTQFWQRRFVGFLPEAARRRFYQKCGCTSLSEYAAKYAALSQATVDDILWIDRKLQHAPVTRLLFESGQEG